METSVSVVITDSWYVKQMLSKSEVANKQQKCFNSGDVLADLVFLSKLLQKNKIIIIINCFPENFKVVQIMSVNNHTIISYNNCWGANLEKYLCMIYNWVFYFISQNEKKSKENLQFNIIYYKNLEFQQDILP